MADIVDKATRSRMMAGIRGQNTQPELLVRSWIHREGLRFRLHKAGLPGKPDVVLSKYKAVIFVHGCFWHRHPGCRYATTPSSNRTFWLKKFRQNVERDRRKAKELRGLGWRVLTIWECELNDRRLGKLVRSVRERSGD